MNDSASTIKDLTGVLPSYNPDSISVRLAHDLVSGFVSPVSGMEKVPLRHALGRVLAEDVVAPFRCHVLTMQRWTVSPFLPGIWICRIP